MAQIRVENLHKAFDQFTAVHDSNFTIENGTFFALLGPSGCGKTTTLRMIAGLELPTSGRILLDGEDVTFRRAAARDIAFVFQMFALYPHMNVAPEHRLSAQVPGHGAPRHSRAGLGDGAASAHRAFVDEQDVEIVRRRPPAGRVGARDGPASEGISDGRAAGCARCRVPAPHVR